MSSTGFRRILGCAAIAACALSSLASADAVINDPVFTVTATSSLGSASFSVNSSSLQEFPAGSGRFRFLQLTPVALQDGPNLIGTLTQGTLFLNPDPQIGLGFAVQAGAADTVFSITSSTLSFVGITNPIVEASAAITTTDIGNNNASLVGINPGGGAYLAQYNGSVPAGITYLNGIPSVGGFGSNSAPINAGPDVLVGTTAVDMSARFSFSLTAGDLASGTSNFLITPEPASLALLALSALVLRRR